MDISTPIPTPAMSKKIVSKIATEIIKMSRGFTSPFRNSLRSFAPLLVALYKNQLKEVIIAIPNTAPRAGSQFCNLNNPQMIFESSSVPFHKSIYHSVMKV